MTMSEMDNKMEQLKKEILSCSKEWMEIISESREMVLSNLAMIVEAPAETFQEEERSALLLDRLLSADLPDPSTDKMDNAIGVIRGQERHDQILVFTHMDHQFSAQTDQNIMIDTDRVSGRGVAEDNFALAVLISLPDIIKRLGLTFKHDIVLLASTRSHGQGDFGGIRHYLEKYHAKIDHAVYLEGLPLGKINYLSLSRVRCNISCHIDVPQDSPWGKISTTSAIRVINEVINRLDSIPLPNQPQTIINVGMVQGGERYSTVSTTASLKLEVLSEDEEAMEKIVGEIHDRCVDVGAKFGVELITDFFGRNVASGINYSHPLVKSAVTIVKSLGCSPLIEYSNTELAVPLAAGIPSVNLGLSTGKAAASGSGYVNLAPMADGIFQVIMLLHAIDQGYCDE